MTTQAKIISILIILALGFLVYLNRDVSIVTPIQPNATNTTPTGRATFEWETEPSEAKNADGQPKTNIFLKATYANGVVERKLVDTESGCGPLPEADKDGAIFQCYAAGAGNKYRVMIVNGVYEVQRKKFEEAEPNKTPKTFEYEKIAEFSSVK